MTLPNATNPPAADPPLQAVTRGGARYDYLLALPPDYTADPTHRWPLLLFLHGAAERGTDLWALTRYGPPKLLLGSPPLSPAEQEVTHTLHASFIVLAPQCPQFEVWDDVALLNLLDQVQTELRIDRARIYLSGLSMGGFGAWSLGLRHPQRFAAIAPVCGGGRISDVLNSGRQHPDALRRLGVWAFHGAKDRVVPLEESERMVEALQHAGVADVKLTAYPEAEHDAWTPTYANPDLYAWLLQHPAGR